MVPQRTSIHGNWSSRLAFILAATGAAVGGAAGAIGGAIIPGVSTVEGAIAGAVLGGVLGAVINNRQYYRDTRGYCYYVDQYGQPHYDYNVRC